MPDVVTMGWHERDRDCSVVFDHHSQPPVKCISDCRGFPSSSSACLSI